MVPAGRPSALLAAALSVGAGGAACVGPTTRALPNDPPRALTAATGAEGAPCASCHADVTEEWRRSLHRSAFTDAAFARAYAREPRTFCRDCHAPEGDAEVGVSCTSCHPVDERAPRPRAGHPPLRAATGASGACARCHEFAFDDERARGALALMQSTVREHAASPSRETSCAECHMPRVDGHRSHRFGITRDPGALREAVRVEATRVGGSAVHVELRAVGVGHAFPTGDLFRRLQVSVETDDAGPPAAATRWLSRRFSTARASTGAVVVVETSDDRLEPGRPSEVLLDLGERGQQRALRWKLEYHRAEVASDETPPSARILLHEGRLSP